MPQTKEGAQKATAAHYGLSVEEYRIKLADGLKHCVDCKQWIDRSLFSIDRSRHDGLVSRCKGCARNRGRQVYAPVALRQRSGPPRQDSTEADPIVAWRLINHQVESGERHHPNSLPCTDCNHRYQPGSRRHEYHHHLGYSPAKHNSVIVLCTTCHRRAHHASTND